MDPLSDVLSLLKPRNYMCGGFDMGGDWSVGFPQHEGIKCYALVQGGGWLILEGTPEPVRLEAGDCFLLPRGRPFRLASDPALIPVDYREIHRTPAKGGIATYQGGGNWLAVGGFFALSGKHAGILLEMLPPVVHIRREADKAALRWSLERMRQELREPQPGGVLIAQQLAYMILVHALRLHLADASQNGVGWLFALADSHMNAAIGAMHDEPARRWTLQELAQRAGMSRSVFALKFKRSVGLSAMDYLTRWRMLLAGDRLANSDDPICIIAPSLGYESESAFSTAFKRVMGCSPRQYSRSDIPDSLHRGSQNAGPAQTRPESEGQRSSGSSLAEMLN